MDRDSIREFFNAAQDVLSLKAATAITLQAEYTELRDVHFNIPVIRKLTRLDQTLMDELVDELDMAITDGIVTTESLRRFCFIRLH